jgi:hypothetical protein
MDWAGLVLGASDEVSECQVEASAPGMESFAAVPALLGPGPGYADLVDLVVVAAFSSFVLP